MKSPASRVPLGFGAFALSAVLIVAGSPAASAAPGPVGPPAPRTADVAGDYIVTLADKPIASYAGEVAGLAATKPIRGRKVDPGSRAAMRYRTYLARQQTAAAARVGVTPTGRYSVALNGFTARLSAGQVAQLRASKGVLSVSRNTVRKATDQTNNVDFLGLSGSMGVWSALGGASRAGRGVVVGVIDSGVWPEAKSFAGSALGTAPPTAADPHRPYRVGNMIHLKKTDGSEFVGTCQTGERFVATACNTKLVGARYFGAAFLESYPQVDGTDFISPRGADGHGTHTASTAAGNADVAASIEGRALGNISGVAPAAKVAIYKALWQGPDEASTGGSTSDIIQAIDAAVSDGVDVINYSVGGSSESSLVDPVQLAFLSAAAAGVFVAASAGNAGPGASTMDNTAPWLTTVAASTMAPRAATVTLGNGKRYAGISTTVSGAVGPAKLVNAAAVKETAASTADAASCAPETLNRARTQGSIVVCDRGVVDRVAKSAEVKRAGGVGMLLVNLTDNSLDGDTHSVPTIHLNPPASAAIKTYAAGSGARATLNPGNLTDRAIPYPQVAGFSARGPSLANGSDVLKPDIAAPGVAVLAAFSPVANPGRNFEFESGTSMAAPQIAGLAALYFSRYPTMAPMSIKSAMMTTASRTVTADGQPSRDAYAEGAGNVRAERMFNPGVVFESGLQDWLGYLEGQGIATESGVDAIQASNLNNPSIAVGKLVGRQTVTRRVTAVKPGYYRAFASVPGFSASVSPGSLRFAAAGQTKTVAITFTRTTAPLGQASFGSMTIIGAGTNARIPVALTPTLLDAPAELAGTGASGSLPYTVRSGISGPFAVTAYGLATSQRERGSVSAEGDPVDYQVSVPAGAKVARFAVVSDEPGADIDLVVSRLVGASYEEVGASQTGSGSESVTLLDPPAGDYLVTVKPFSEAVGTDESLYTVTNGVVPGTATGNFTVTPATQQATSGRDLSLTASWSGLDPSKPYLGFVEYPGGSGTLVMVN